MKKYSLTAALCILLCLGLAACGSKDGDSNKKVETDRGIYINFVTDTLPPETEAVPEDTETEASEETVQAPETEQSPVVDTEYETTAEPVTDELPIPGTVIPDLPDMEPVEIPDIDFGDAEAVDIFGAVSAGNTISGEFKSKQSDKINLVVKYNCRAEEDGIVVIGLEVGLETYAIYCGARENTGCIIVNGVPVPFSTDELSHDQNIRKYIPFTVYTYQCDVGEAFCHVDVSWPFNGTYGGTYIDNLTASAIFSWAPPY